MGAALDHASVCFALARMLFKRRALLTNSKLLVKATPDLITMPFSFSGSQVIYPKGHIIHPAAHLHAHMSRVGSWD